MPYVSKRADEVISSPIRRYVPAMLAAEKAGVKVFKVHIGDPDLPMPSAFMDAVRNYRSKNLSYAPSSGFEEHSRGWQSYYRRFGVNLGMKNIIPTDGCSEALAFALMAVADPGDQVIVFQPLYVNFRSIAVMLGIELVPVMLSIENDFAMPPLDVIRKKIGPRTKAILVINPDNPTGKVWSSGEMGEIIDLAKEHDLFVLFDETYREFRFDGQAPVCMLGYADAREHVIVLDSMSKRYTLPGGRLGCIASYNEHVMHSALKFAQARLSTGTLGQLGAVPLLNDCVSYVNDAVKEYKQRQSVVEAGLAKIEGAVYKPAKGAFYQVVGLPIDDADQFVGFMLGGFRYENQTVMVTPMPDFYVTPGLGLNEVRIAYVLNEQDLTTAIDLLRRGVEAYNQR